MTKLREQVETLRRIWGGFSPARVLITANNFRIFDHLRKPVSARGLAEALGADRRATEILLDGLVSLGLLKKRGGQYINTAISKRLLVSGGPYYQGDMIRHADTLWQNWSGLDKAVKTGKPPRMASDHDSYIRGMHNLAMLKVKEILSGSRLRDVRRALDLGGGPGTYAAEMAKRGISVTLFDRPETLDISRKMIRRGGTRGVRLLAGDFFTDSIGRGYDLILISHVMHIFSPEENLKILQKAKEALNPRGRILVHEFRIDEDRTSPRLAAIFSVNMLVNTDSGRCYSPGEIKEWLSKIGLKEIKSKTLDETILIQGRRDDKKKKIW